MNQAIYIVEYSSIPIGIYVLDRMVKHAPADILYAKPVCIGKFLIVVGGGVDDVREAQRAAASAQNAKALQQYLLTNAHSEILAHFRRAPGQKSAAGGPAVGILETRHAASGFYSLDAALKCGNVRLEHLWLGHFIGGKFCYVLRGQVADIHSAFVAAQKDLDPSEIVDSQILPAMDKAVMACLFSAHFVQNAR
ncbi:MAG: BMC domain-containing protein [Oscillospiraceae bacterium]|jgi:microcompartment protein CcmL/EutN|nr:BMC domain-containing protein [Oscillospiraceae bacterium]